MSELSGAMHTPETLPGLPVAEGTWPVVGHLYSMWKDRAGLLLLSTRKLGPLFWIHMGFGRWSLVVAGEGAREVMKNQKTRSDIMGGSANHITDHTMLVVDGDPHKRIRGSMNAPFTPKGISAAEVGSVIGEVLTRHIERWRGQRSLRVLSVTSEIAIDVIFRIMGISDADLPAWREVYGRYISAGMVLPIDLPGSPKWRSKKAGEWMDKELRQLINKALAEGESDSLLGALAHGTDEKGRKLEVEELLANLRILGLAGHETTASTMAWMMLHVAHDPALWDEIVEEATSRQEPPTSPKDLERFPKAEALFRECLRLYPPIHLLPPRRVVEPIEVHGFTIPPQTRVSASLFSLSMDPEEYPEPEKIRLDRWTELGRKPRPSESIQFGGGPHFCLGYHLAVLEGTQFIVYAARALKEQGLWPVLSADLPTPTFIPLTRPPSDAEIQLRLRH